MVKSRVFFGDGHPTFNRNPYNGYMKPYYWVDLDPDTYEYWDIYYTNWLAGFLNHQQSHHQKRNGLLLNADKKHLLLPMAHTIHGSGMIYPTFGISCYNYI